MGVRPTGLTGNGFALAEVLVGALLCSIFSALLFTGATASQRYIACIQLRTAAGKFAQDLLCIRECALAGSNLAYVELDSHRNGYWVYRKPNLGIKRDFASGGSAMFKFSNIPSYKIRFSVNGVPSASGTFILQHEAVPELEMKVILQPVTGRILVEGLGY